MSDILLQPSRHLTGPHRVTATLRPLRLAYLVAPDDAGMALAAIDACCLLWGGTRQVLIPCPEGGVPDAFWSAILEIHDPDELIDLVGVSQDYLEQQEQSALRPACRWTYPTETMLLQGALVTSILRRLVERGEWSPGHAILRLHPLFGHALALPLAYRHGHLERRPMSRIDPMHEAYVGVHLDTLVQLHRVDPRRLPDEELVRLVTEYPLAPSTPEEPGYIGPPAHCLIDLASALGANVSVSYPLGTPLDDARRHGAPHWHQPVVVGKPDSVPDLCLAWNLRAHRPHQAEPVWVSPAWLDDATVRARLEAIREANQLMDRGRHGLAAGWLGLISASLTDDELARLTAPLPDAVALPRDAIHHLFPHRLHIGRNRRSTVIFIEGVADVALPDASDLGSFRWPETLGVSVEIPGWRLPRMPQPAFGSTTDVARVAIDGLADALQVSFSTLPDLVTVDGRNGQEALDALAAAAGLRAEPSDKGQLGVAVLDLFGSPVALALLASSRVYELINGLATGIVSRQAVQAAIARHAPQWTTTEAIDAVVETLEQGLAAEGQFDRRSSAADQVKAALRVGRDDAEWVLKFLVEQGIVFRGFEVRCRRCGLLRWHPVDRLAATYTCDGCLTTTPMPLSVDDPLVWRYRLNELVGRAVDQGVLPHLLAVRHLVDESRHPDSGLLGVLPGVAFRTVEGTASNSGQSAEADLVAIVDGRVLLGECKRTGTGLRPADVTKTCGLAERFEQPVVVFATPTSFDEASESLEEVRKARERFDIEVWEEPDMLDPRPHRDLPQQTPEAYLTSVVAWLRDRAIH